MKTFYVCQSIGVIIDGLRRGTEALRNDKMADYLYAGLHVIIGAMGVFFALTEL